MRGTDPDRATRDLYQAIARGDHPSWRLEVQIMTAEQAKEYRFDPFDITKVWPHADFPPMDRRPSGAQSQPGELLRRGGAGGFLPGQLRARHRTVPGQDAAGTPLQLPRHPPPPAGTQLPPAAGERSEGVQGGQLPARRRHALRRQRRVGAQLLAEQLRRPGPRSERRGTVAGSVRGGRPPAVYPSQR